MAGVNEPGYSLDRSPMRRGILVAVPSKPSRPSLPQAPSDALVCIVDDDESIRRGLARLFRSARMAAETFASGEELLDRAPHDGPSCLVLDVRMPGLDGLELQQALANREAQIVFLTGHGDVPMCADAMKAGAIDFLTKPVDDEELLAAVARALARSVEVRKAAAERAAARARLDTLTPREFEVMQRVIGGLLNKQIADELGAAEKTIKIHRGRVMEKMGVISVADLVRVAQSRGRRARGELTGNRPKVRLPHPRAPALACALPMKVPALRLILIALTLASPALAQKPAPTAEQLKSWVDVRQQRVNLLRDEIKQTDARIESRLDVIVDTLKTISDSKDSRTKVARMKEDTGKRLMKTITYYDQKRAALKQELRSPRLNLTAEEKQKMIAVFDARITKRTQQILELNKSMPTHQEHERYTATGGGWYGTDYERNKEFEQNRRMTSHSNTQRDAILKQIDAAPGSPRCPEPHAQDATRLGHRRRTTQGADRGTRARPTR